MTLGDFGLTAPPEETRMTTTTKTPTITADEVAEARARTRSQVGKARTACTLAAASATTPADGRALLAHAAQLSERLLDDWQLGIVADLAEHHAEHDADCRSELCVMDDDELVEMADRWAVPWPALATWLRAMAEAPEADNHPLTASEAELMFAAIDEGRAMRGER